VGRWAAQGKEREQAGAGGDSGLTSTTDPSGAGPDTGVTGTSDLEGTGPTRAEVDGDPTDKADTRAGR
jgi:hypothetical protein